MIENKFIFFNCKFIIVLEKYTGVKFGLEILGIFFYMENY